MFRTMIVVAIAMLFGIPANAQDPLPRKDLDNRIDQVLYEVSRIGTDLFNRAGNEEGCFRIYEGSLRTVVGLLDHRPELQKNVRDSLSRAEREAAPQRSFTLRQAVEDIRRSVKPGSARPAPPVPVTLWQRLGGAPGVTRIVKEFLAAAGKDPKVNLDRGGKHKIDAPKLERLLVEMVSAVSGGPFKYSGRDMKSAHAGMKITEAEFNAMADHLSAVLKANKVSQRDTDELMTIVGSTKKDVVEVK